MKKTKILVPALGLLALSTVASVTGTVAWFTANAKVNVSFTEFKIEKLTENLTVASQNVMGVTVDSGDGSITPTQYGTSYVTLTHASVNLTNSDVWSKSSTGVTEKKSAKDSAMFDNFFENNPAMVAKWEDPDTKTTIQTLYALAWESTFTYNADKKVNLYFDVDSDFDYGTNSDAKRTGRGFRLAMVKSDNKFVVWSPAQAELMCYDDGSYPQSGSPATDVKKKSCYVTGTSTVGEYNAAVDGNLIVENDGTVDSIDSSMKGSVARKDCLGSFTTSTNTITIKFIAWFEGEDPNVVDDGVLETVKADLGFYIRESLD